MGFKKHIALIFLIFFYPFAYSLGQTHIYPCLDRFHHNFSKQYKNSSLSDYVRGFEVNKRRVGKQDVIVASLVDPVDEKKKKLFVTKTKARVCDPSAEAGSRCSKAEDRHLNASLSRHISVLPDVYKDTLRNLQTGSEGSNFDPTKSYHPGDIVNDLGECMRVSRALRRKIIKKSKALAAIHNEVFNTSTREHTSSVKEEGAVLIDADMGKLNNPR